MLEQDLVKHVPTEKSKSGMIAARYFNISFAKALNPNVISDSQYSDM